MFRVRSVKRVRRQRIASGLQKPKFTRRYTVSAVVTAILMTLVLIIPASAHDKAVVIRTHTNMWVPNHMFRSEYERCSLPSRKSLAALTGSKLKNWRKPYFGNREILYEGDPDVVIRIKIRKDQELVTGGETTNKLKYYGFGDTYVGTHNFYFRCRNSRSGWFNPNVGSICGPNGGVAMLERATHRQWYTVFEDGRSIPDRIYSYRRLASLPSFFVPKDATFETVDRHGHTHTTLMGYLTKTVNARKSYSRPWVFVNGFC